MAGINLSTLGEAKDNRALKSTRSFQLKVISILFAGFIIMIILYFIAFISIPIFLIFMAVILYWLYKRGRKYKIASDEVLAQLAKENGWQTITQIPDDAKPVMKSTQFNESIKPKLQGELNSLPFWLLSGDTAVLMMDAKKPVPKAIFSSALLNFGAVKGFVNSAIKAEGLAQIKLEGDFDKYFILYAKPQEKLDVLSIVAPDFMATLLDKGLIQSISFSEHYVFISAFSGFNEQVRALFEAGEGLTKELTD